MTAIEMYKKGYTLKAISQILSCSRSSVNRQLVASGEYVANRLHKPRTSKECTEAAIQLLAAGKSWVYVSEKIGYSIEALKRAINYYAAQGLI